MLVLVGMLLNHAPVFRGVNFDEGGRTDYPIVGDYPTQTPEQIAQFNLSIRRLIAETNLCLPPNRWRHFSLRVTGCFFEVVTVPNGCN